MLLGTQDVLSQTYIGRYHLSLQESIQDSAKASWNQTAQFAVFGRKGGHVDSFESPVRDGFCRMTSKVKKRIGVL